MKKKLLQSFCWILVLMSSLSLHAQVQFSITQTGNVYQVKMKPTVNYSGTAANTLSAQVTIVAPTGSFTPIANTLQSQFGAWTYVNQITRGPIENPNSDYISFYMSSPVSTATYVAGTEQNLFSFQANGTCSGTIQLINNTTDPFFPNAITGTNSQNINVGNQIAISGNGNLNNAWNSNYGSGVSCPNAPPCGLKYELVKLSNNTYQVNMIPQVTYSSPNNLTSTQQVTLKVPTGLAYTNLVSLTSGATYVQGSRVNTPSQSPNNDYIMFNLSNLGTSALTYTSGVAVPLFKFDVPGTCTGSLAFMPNNDLFTTNTSFNSKQQTTVLGYGQPDIPICFEGTGATPCPTATVSNTCLIEYELESLGNGKFQVSMIPQVSYASPNNITSTQQITLKVPTGFQYNNLASLTAGATYIQGSRVNTPSQASGFDYIMFNLSNLGTSALTYTNGAKIPLFSFDKIGACTGEILALMPNNDPFTANTSFNSKQQLTVLGYGQPDIPICFKGTGTAVCPPPTSCLVEYEIEALANGRFQFSMTPKVSYASPNNLTSTQQMTVKVPTGFQYTNLTNLVPGATYIQGSRVNGVGGFDYLMFNLSNLGTSALSYTNGVKVPLFYFDKSGACLGDSLRLMRNNDPFASNTNYNSKQQLTVLGYGQPDIPICFKGTGAAQCQNVVAQNCLIKYQLENVNGCEYQVSMTPDTSWVTTGNITKTAKITLRVPHNCFVVSDLTSLNFGANFSAGQVIQAPSDNPGYDYVCFNMTTVPTVAIPYVKGQKVPLFTFKNSGNCCGNIELMPMTDPMASGNSLNINVDQHWTTSGTAASGVTPCIVGQPLPCISNTNSNILGADRTICAGQSTQLNVTGAYTSYNWSPAATLSSATIASPTATPLTTTTYSVTATTIGGCPIKDEIVVNVTATPTITSATSANSTNCTTTNGSIIINATGSGTIEYSINNGTTWTISNTFNNLAAASYTVLVRTQGSTCTQAYAQNPIVITAAGLPIITNVTPTNPNACTSANGSITVTATGGSGVYEYRLNGGAWQTSNIFGSLGATSYTLEVRSAGTTCITAYAQNPIVLTGNAGFSVSAINATNPTCAATDGQLTVTVTGAGGPFQYSLNNGAYQYSPYFVGLSANTYTVQVKDASGICTVTSPSVTLTAPSAPSILAVTPTTTSDCSLSDGAINVTASGGVAPLEYSINGSTWQQSNIFTNVAAGSYTIRVRNADNSCMATAATPVVVNMPPMPTITNVSATAPASCGAATGTINVTGAGGQGQLEFSIDGVTWQTGGTFTGLISGTYNVFIRNQDNSCAKPYPGNPIVINAGQAPSLINITKTLPTTCGGNNGSIVITAQGTSAIEYSINNGVNFQASNTFNNLSANTYNIVVRYANATSCTSTIPNCIIPAANPATISSVTPTATTDCGQSDGTITIAANGGTAPLQYSINNGVSYQYSNVFTGVAAGSYTIKVKNVDGTCEVTHNALVSVGSPASPSLSASITTATSCGASTGSITVNATGGTAPLQYSINGIVWQNSNVFSGLSAGSYYVRVRNANGSCMVVSNALTIVNQPNGSNITLVSVSNSTICSTTATGNGSITITASGVGALQYSINGGLNFQSTGSFSNLAAETYNIVVRNVDGTCPAIVSPITITAPTAPTIISVVSTNPADCSTGGTVTVTANGSTALEYSLNGTTWQSSNIFTNVTAGNYTVRVRNIGSASCVATSPTPITLTSPTPPSILTVISGAPASCGQANGSITINSSPSTGVQYSIDNIHWQNTGIFAGLAAGTYNVRIRYATGLCNTIYANNPVTLNAQNGLQVVSTQVANPNICGTNNGSVTIYMLGGSAPYQYSINNGTTYQFSNVFTELAAGNYTILIKDATGACSTSTVASLTAPTAPATPILVTTSATSCTLPTGSVSISSPAGATYEYSINNGLNWQTATTFNNLIAGTYVVAVRTIGTSCIAYSAATTVNMPTMPIISDVDAAFGVSGCSVVNGSIFVNVSNAGSWEYSKDGGLTWQTSFTFNNLTQGAYYIMVRPTGKTDCAKAYQGNPIILTAPAAPVVLSTIVIQPAACSAGTGSITINAQGATEYSVNNGTTWQTSNTFAGLAAGTYNIVVRNDLGCISNGTPVQIQGGNAPTAMTFAATPISNCGLTNGMISVTSVSGGTAPYEYSINGTTWQTSNVFANLSASNYTIRVRSAGSACSYTYPTAIAITAPATPTFNAVNSTPATCGSNNGTITASASAGATYSIDGINYQASGSFANLAPGSYSVFIKNTNNTCVTPYSLNPVVVSQTPGVSITSVVATQISSCNASNGAITINASGGSAPYEYSINGGVSFQASNIFTGLAAATYEIVVRGTGASAQCPTTYAPITLFAPAAPRIAVTVSTNPTACKQDGSITAYGTGGVLPLEYSIDGTAWQTSNTFSNLTAGTYAIRVRNANGTCSITAPNTVTLTSPSALSVTNVAKTNPTTCTATNGTITISATPNTNVQYSIDGLTWYDSPSFTGLAAGSYTAYVRNANGTCPTPYTANPIQLNGTGAPSIVNIDKMNPTDCGATNGSITVEVLNTGVQYKYSIDNGVTYQLSNYFAGLPAGNYTVKVSDLAGNCPVTAAVSLVSPQGTTITSVNATPVTNCNTNTGSISITATPNTGIQYSIDNGATWSNSNVFTGLAAGSYIVSIRNTNGTCVKTNTVAAVVAEPTRPTINSVTSSNPTLCTTSNGTITVSASGGTGTFEYSINGVTWQAAGSFAGLVAGSYTVMVRNAGTTCVENYAQTIVLSAPTAPAIQSVIGTNPTTCNGNNGSITVTAFGVGTLEYSINGGTSYQASNVFNGLISGTYNIRVRSVGTTCSVAYPQVTLTAPSAPIIASAIATAITNCNATDGKITISASNAQNATMEYSVDGTNWFSTNVIQYLAAGNYSVRVRIQGTTCMTTATTQTTVSSPTTNLVISTVTTTNPTACGANNGTISVNSTGGSAPIEYSIDNINWQTSTQFINLPAGSYTVFARNNGGICAVAYGSNPVILTPNIASPIIPTVSKTNVSSCTQNNGSLTITATGGTPPLQYSIDGGQTWVANNIFNNLAAGYYEIAVRNNDGTCAAIHVPVQITAPDAPVLIAAILTKPTDCANPNAAITILAAGGIPPLQYSIDDEGTWTTNNVFPNLGVGIYNVWIRNSNGTCAVPAANNPIISCEFDLALRKRVSANQDTIVRLGQDVNFDIKVYNQGVVTAKDIEIVDYLPIGTILSPNDNNGWQYVDATTGALTSVTPKLTPTTALKVKKIIAGPIVSKDSTLAQIKLRIMFGGPNLRLVNVAEIAGAKDLTGVPRQDGDSTPDDTKGNDKEKDDVVDDKGAIDEDDEDPAPIRLEDYDPHGYIYCDKEGTLLKGGKIQLVTAPVGGAIYFANDTTGTPIDGRDGVYQFFTNGVPGNYSITYINPNGFALSTMILPNAGAFNPAGTDGTSIDKDNTINNVVKLGADATNGVMNTIALGQNPYYLSFTFNPNETTIISHNNIPVGCACVNSIVCEDVNDNGIAEPTEPGVNGVTVQAYDCVSNALVGTTITANGGKYKISALPAGSYKLKFILPSGYSYVQNGSPVAVNTQGETACFPLALNGCEDKPVCVKICPAITVTPNVTICAGTSTTLSAAGGTTYSWSGAGLSSNSGASVTATPTTTTVYTVSSNSGNCTSTASVTVTVVTPPSSNFSVSVTQPTTCGTNNGSITITATPNTGLEYSIDNGNTWSATNVFANLAPSAYIVKIRNAGSQCSVAYGSNPVQLSPASAPSVTNVTSVNPNNCTNPNGTITITATGGSGTYQYSIDNGATWQFPNQFTGVAAGTYQIKVRNSNGTCEVTYPAVTLTNNVPVINTVNVVSDCANNNRSITILASGGVAPLEYSINNGATWTTNNVFSNLAAGFYTVKVRNFNGTCEVAYANGQIALCAFDLALVKKLVPGQTSTVRLGDIIQYEITVINQGAINATNIQVVDYIPTGMQLFPTGNNGWTAAGTDMATNTIQSLAAGASVTLNMSLRLVFGSPNTSLKNVAEIKDAKDASGNSITDIDSTPDMIKGNDNEKDNVTNEDGKNGGDEDDSDSELVTLDNFDPSGYVYCEKTGKIITGGKMKLVSAPTGGDIFFTTNANGEVLDGSTGMYQIFTNGVAGTYTFTYEHPNKYPISAACPPQNGAFNPAGKDGDTTYDKDGLKNGTIHLGALGVNGYLSDKSCAANKYFLSFQLDKDEKTLIATNNIPVDCGVIVGKICADANGDGIPQSTEPGMAGMKVLLFDCNSTTGVAIASTITNADGKYTFDGLTGGKYKVQIIAAQGQIIKGGTFNQAGYSACTDVKFGECITMNACVSACPTINDVLTVMPWCPKNNGVIIIDAVCQGDLEYSIDGGTTYQHLNAFMNLTPGSYTIKVKSAGCEQEYKSVVVLACENDNGGSGKGSISGKAFKDCSGAGIKGNNKGVAGVKVTLTGTSTKTTTTDANGKYNFADVAAGSYIVTFDKPAGFDFSKQDQGGNDTNDSDVSANGITGNVTVAANQLVDNVDAGLKDVEAPKITFTHPWLVGKKHNDDIYMECGEEYFFTAKDAILADNCDTNPSVKFGEDPVIISKTCDKDGYLAKMHCGWIATDECGNKTEIWFNFYVRDTKAPALSGVPADVTVTSLSQVTAATVSAKDQCATKVDVKFSESINGKIITRTWTTTDPCGNTNSAKQIITIKDDVVTGCKIDVLPIAVTSPASCNGKDGKAKLAPNNFTFKWGDGYTGDTRLDLGVGSYIVTVTDAQGCTGEVLVKILDKCGTGVLEMSAAREVKQVACGKADNEYCLDLNMEEMAKLGYTLYDNGQSLEGAMKPCEVVLNHEFTLDGVEDYKNVTLESWTINGVKVSGTFSGLKELTTMMNKWDNKSTWKLDELTGTISTVNPQANRYGAMQIGLNDGSGISWNFSVSEYSGTKGIRIPVRLGVHNIELVQKSANYRDTFNLHLVCTNPNRFELDLEVGDLQEVDLATTELVGTKCAINIVESENSPVAEFIKNPRKSEAMRVVEAMEVGKEHIMFAMCDEFNVCDTATIVVTVREKRKDATPIDSTLVIYNGFSPNNDGHNDAFYIKNIEYYPTSYLTIYNRWGNQVYAIEGYQNDWKGTFEDKQLADGTYFYTLEVDGQKMRSGYVEIKR